MRCCRTGKRWKQEWMMEMEEGGLGRPVDFELLDLLSYLGDCARTSTYGDAALYEKGGRG